MGKNYDLSNDTTHHFEMEDYFDVVPVTIGQSFNVGDARVETRRTLHPLPCFAVKIHFQGRCWTYSCDTSYDPELIDFLSEGDLIFHETGDGFHTPLKDLVALPDSLKKKLVLVHFPDTYDVDRSPFPTPRDGELFTV